MVLIKLHISIRKNILYKTIKLLFSNDGSSIGIEDKLDLIFWDNSAILTFNCGCPDKYYRCVVNEGNLREHEEDKHVAYDRARSVTRRHSLDFYSII